MMAEQTGMDKDERCEKSKKISALLCKLGLIPEGSVVNAIIFNFIDEGKKQAGFGRLSTTNDSEVVYLCELAKSLIIGNALKTPQPKLPQEEPNYIG